MPYLCVLALTALAVFPGRLLASGRLDLVETIPSGCAYRTDSVPSSTYGMMTSPDGADIYLPSESKVYRFRRNAATGSLTFAPTFADQRLPATYAFNVLSLSESTLTPDGRHLLLLRGSFSAAHQIVVLGRDTTTGDLTVVQEVDVPTLGDPRILVSPDGSHVYVSSRRSFRRFARDVVSGALSDLGGTVVLSPEGNYATFATSGDGMQVYALGTRPQGGEVAILDAWARNPVTGDLNPVQSFDNFADSAYLSEGYDVVMSPDGSDLYTVQMSAVIRTRIAQFRRAPSGLLTFAGFTQVAEEMRSGDLAIRADGRFLYLGTLNRGKVVVVARDTVTGELASAGQLEGSGLLSLTADGDLYSFDNSSEGSRHLVARRLDAATGLGPIVDVEGLTRRAGAIAVTPDGAHVYVTCPWEAAVAGFAVHPDTGALTPAGKLVDGGRGYLSVGPIVVSPDGAHVYVESLHGVGLATLARNPLTGGLSFASALLQDSARVGRRILQLAVSSDGSHLYGSGYLSGFPAGFPGVVALARDSGTGALTHVQDLPRPPQVDFVGGITIPPDGAHVYTSERRGDFGSPDFISVSFRRDPITGRLDDEKTRSLRGLWPTADAEGRHIYVAGEEVVVKSRDPVSGQLTDVQTFIGTDLRLGPLTVGGDGLYAHAVSDYTGAAALLTWRRDAVSGRLALVQREPVPAEPVWPSQVNPTVVTSNGGRDVYWLDETNTVFHYRRRQPCAPARLADCHVPTQPGAASLTLVDQPGTTSNAMKLRWTRGTAVSLAELGAPDVSTHYAACLYDAAGPQPVAALLAPAGETCRRGPCWRARAQGFAYADIDRTPDGVARAIVKPGAAGQSSLRWQANKGAMPPLGLPLQGPVVMQIQASNGTCWEASFSNPTVNDGTRWQASSD